SAGAEFDPRLDVVIAVGLSTVTQPPQPIGERAIASEDRAAVAERAEILGWIEAERAGDADCSHRPSGRRGEVRLTTVLDDRELVRRGDALDAGHVSR